MAMARYHDGRSGAIHEVEAFVFGRHLRLAHRDGGTMVTWPLDAVMAAPERDPDGLVHLSTRTGPGMVLVKDSGLLDALRRAGVRLPGTARWRPWQWVAGSAAAACVLAACGILLNEVPTMIAAVIPLSWERRLAAPTEALISASARRCDGAGGQAALTSFVERLRAAGHITTPVRIEALNDKMINAFTLPAGHIIVMRGIIDTASDGAMLAGVIAHELGHVAHRDTTTLMLRRTGVSMLMSLIGFGDGGTAASSLTNLMSLAYGRSAEAAADATALDLLSTAGLRADGLSRFFSVMEAKGGAGAPGLPTWLHNHPANEDRLTKTASPETGAMPFTDDEWNAIRAMCGGGQSSL
jgi:Zn-dependent protease with chaperone function